MISLTQRTLSEKGNKKKHGLFRDPNQSSDIEEFIALETLKSKEELKQYMIYCGRPGLWHDWIKFQGNARKERQKQIELAKRQREKWCNNWYYTGLVCWCSRYCLACLVCFSIEGDVMAKGSTATKRDPKKWAAAARAKAKMGGKHSARAMQLAVKYYKDSGGTYSGKKKSSNKLSNGQSEMENQVVRTAQSVQRQRVTLFT